MPWDVIYFRTADGAVPAAEFLASAPPKVAANLLAVLNAVAEAPPPQFSGGGKWEAMHAPMGGYYEVRAGGPKREQFRLFCLLENADSAELGRRGLQRPAVAVITGMRKPWRTAFGKRDYAAVRRFGDQHFACYPRRVAE